MTRAERNIEWIEKFCRIPEGPTIGQPMRLRDWQRDWLISVYDNPHITRQAILTMPRKNGKTALLASLLLLHLCGPEAKPNTQLYSAAQSRDQAATVYKLAAKMVRLSPLLLPYVGMRDSGKELFCRQLGTTYAALSSDTKTAHGKSPIFAVHDELGQVRGPESSLYEAVETGMGAHEHPLSIIISTQAPTDNDLLSRLIDDALRGSDPKTVVRVYSAPLDADPFAEETLRQCNPAWGDFLNAEEVMRTSVAASRMKSREAMYRNLHLNQRVEAGSPFVSRSAWAACNAQPVSLAGMRVYGGLDLSTTTDLSSLVWIGEDAGIWNAKCRFWLPGETLRERAEQDKVAYDVWADEGFIDPTPGATVDYEYVAEQLRRDFDEMEVVKVAFDRYNMRFLVPWLHRAGFSAEEIEEHFVAFGQGMVSMSPAIRELESAILNRRLAHGDNPVLAMCAFNARVERDAAENRKFSKVKSSGRIDGLVALAMAFGVAPSESSDTGPSVYEERGLLFA